MNDTAGGMFTGYVCGIRTFEGTRFFRLFGSSRKQRTWRDLPKEIVGLIDEYPFDTGCKETIEAIKRRELQIKDAQERKSVLMSCYLSVAIDYFINRDYRYAVRYIKKANSLYRHLVHSDEAYRQQARNVHFYAQLLWGVILYIRGSDIKALLKLRSCCKIDHNTAVMQFIEDVKQKKSFGS